MVPEGRRHATSDIPTIRRAALRPVGVHPDRVDRALKRRLEPQLAEVEDLHGTKPAVAAE